MDIPVTPSSSRQQSSRQQTFSLTSARITICKMQQVNSADDIKIFGGSFPMTVKQSITRKYCYAHHVSKYPARRPSIIATAHSVEPGRVSIFCEYGYQALLDSSRACTSRLPMVFIGYPVISEIFLSAGHRRC